MSRRKRCHFIVRGARVLDRTFDKTLPQVSLFVNFSGMIGNMQSKLSSNVADLSDDQRKVVESLIGHKLRREQVLYWLVVSPGREPTSAAKAESRSGLQELFEKVDRRFAEQGTTEEEFGMAVDEAVKRVASSDFSSYWRTARST